MVQDKLKTGTTTIGIHIKDGVIIAADNRATTYKIETDNFIKVFQIADKIAITIAGYVAPAQRFVRAMKSEIKLMELKNERPIRVKEAANLLSSIQFSAIAQGLVVASIMGGYDSREGPALYDLGPDGTVKSNLEKYYSDGSGSIFAKSVLDMDYKEGMSKKEGLELIEKAFSAAFKNDTASGGGYVALLITEDGVEEIEKKKIKTEFVSA